MYLTRLYFYLFFLIFLTSCISSSPTSKYFLLEPISTKGEGTEAKIQIALAAIKIPKYINRPQIVSTTGKNQYHISEVNRWAESLDQNISRVLQQNLTLLVPAEVFLSNKSLQAKQAKFRVDVNVLEFYVGQHDQAMLVVQWNVNADGQNIVSRLSSYQSPASKNDYAIMVAGLNQCINLMSHDIAEVIQSIVLNN